ncbi:MAG TPA: PHB depolymerase family esterase [Steroidobacteraceae bacterium]|nr:PHB depolymerase family esterase [Steroidobacteraceae bacterium]
MQVDPGSVARSTLIPAAALAIAALLVAGARARAASAAVPAAPVGPSTQVQFSDYSPLSASAEIMRRLLSPLTAAEVERSLERSHERLSEQSIDLAAERFALYVPAQAPPDGYALLTFVAPWDEAWLPEGWAPVLERHGMIFVSAARSSNRADPIGRREPLALLATYNVMQRYRVNPERVYIGGFSGGARMALRLALAYPDLYRGALLNAGSDPLDAGPPSPPPRELLERFQEGTRIVYLTGEYDTLHLAMDSASEDSMRDWCVYDVAAEVTHGASHEIASAAALSRALTALATHVRAEPAKLAACRAAIDRRLAARLAEVRSLIDAGKRPEAAKRLEELDRRFGALAAPQSLALAAQLSP